MKFPDEPVSMASRKRKKRIRLPSGVRGSISQQVRPYPHNDGRTCLAGFFDLKAGAESFRISLAIPAL